MSGLAMDGAKPKAPWHLWVVGLLALLWNGAGAYTIMSAQQGSLADVNPDEAAYYAAQQTWFVAVTDIALMAAIVGAVAVLLRSRYAEGAFLFSLVAIVISNTYDLAMGTSRMFTNNMTVVVTCLIWVLAALQLWYAAVMKRRRVLR